MWTDAEALLDLPWKSLGSLLSDRAAAHGERTLLRFEGRDVSFREMEERSNRLARGLEGWGVAPEEAVAVLLPNGIGFPTAWLALVKRGAVAVPVNPAYRRNDLLHVLGDSGARRVVTDAAGLRALREVDPGAERWSAGVLTGGAGSRRPDAPGAVSAGNEGSDAPPASSPPAIDLERAMAAASPEPLPDPAGPSSVASIQYTSGTTGFPKGCLLTHEYWLVLGRTTALYAGLGPGDVDLTAQPFYYMDPQWNLVACMMAGIPLVVLPGFSASTFWDTVRDEGVTFFYVIGTMPVYLYKQPERPEVERGHRVRLAMCSGIPPALHAAFEERWDCPWREAFGMTETGADLVVPIDDASTVGTGAVGRPVATKEARVVDADGTELPDGETGELVIRGRPMMLGYHGDPEATAERIRDGWLHTGDLARRDGAGYFHIVGRIKEMVRRAGENISAREVESVLCEHPDVRAAAVVPVPDELRGEEVKAFVQLRPGVDRGGLDPAALVEHVRERIAAFKAPRFIEYVEDFPRTPSERIAKPRLLERRDQRAGAWDASEGRWLPIPEETRG